jgi:conserved domain protein
MTNLITEEVRKFIESKKESYDNMTEEKWEVLEDKLVSEIEEASKELEEDDTLEDLIENTLYFNSAMDEIIMRIAEK